MRKSGFEMKKILTVLCVLGWALSAQANLFVVKNVSVSAVADSGVKAKEAALMQGAQSAFNILLAKVSLLPAGAELPVLAPEDIVNFVQDVVVNEEQTTPTKYTGSLNFNFDQQAVETFLKGQKIPFLTQEPPVSMFIPIWKQNGVAVGFGADNPLYLAAQQADFNDALFQIKVPAIEMVENVPLTPALLQGEALSEFIPLAKQNGAERVLWVFVEQYSNLYRLRARLYPADIAGEEVDFTVSAQSSDQVLVASKLLEKALAQMDQNWRLNQLVADGGEQLTFIIRARNLNTWLAVQKQLVDIIGADKITIRGMDSAGVTISVLPTGSVPQLIQKLEQKQFVLTPVGENIWRLDNALDLNNSLKSEQLQ